MGGTEKTVRELMEEWLDARGAKLRKSSFDTYLRTIHKYIVPLLGDLSLGEVNRDVLKGFIRSLSERGLSDKSVWDVNTKLNAALHWAVERGYIEHAEFCVRTKSPAASQPRIMTPQQRGRLETHLFHQGGAVAAGFLLCLNAGLLPGELCALHWRDIDLKNERIRVDKTMQRLLNRNQSARGKRSGRVGKTYVTTLPENRRFVPIPQKLIPLLESLPHHPEGYFLTGDQNNYLEPRTMQGKLKQCLSQCGLDESISFNQFRATFITSELSKGTDLCQVVRWVGAKRFAHIGDKYGAFLASGPLRETEPC